MAVGMQRTTLSKFNPVDVALEAMRDLFDEKTADMTQQQRERFAEELSEEIEDRLGKLTTELIG